MESNYNNTDFEHYIKQNADQYRMFPSDKVWKGINSALHPRKKWYGFLLAFVLLLIASAVTWVMTTYPSSKNENTVTFTNTAVTAPVDKPASMEQTSEDIKNLLLFDKFPQDNSLATQSVTDESVSNSIALLQPVQDDMAEKTMAIAAASQQHPQFQTNPPALAGGININSSHTTITETKPAGIEKKLYADQPAITADNTPDNKADNSPNEVYLPLAVENAINVYSYKKPARTISWQLVIVPTVSYRKLHVNNSLDKPFDPNTPFTRLPDINNAVTHKPDIGLQIGVSGRYPITRDLKLRGGVQFNINRYGLKAYPIKGEVVTFALNGDNSISTLSYYKNTGSSQSDWLKNFYFSVSAPIGLELKLLGNKRTSFGIAGTIQPTYVVSDRAYLITTDYNNYAEVPSLVRRVNLNTGFETFINYTRGKTKWQIGPQVRYQLLSSFRNQYPIKENLVDFGVKIGITLNE